MITHIEIDGFKSFLDFKLDVPPFLALVGANASGKSNLLDAIELLRDVSLGDDESFLRPTRGRPHEQYHITGSGAAVDLFSIGAEMLTSFDDGIVPFSLHSTVRRDGASMVLRGPRDLAELEGAAIWPDPVLEAVGRGRSAFDAAQIGNAVEDLARCDKAIAGETRAWRVYGPDPSKMRALAPAADTRALTRSGDNLAAVLGRMSARQAFSDLVVDLTALLPTVKAVVPQLDEHRQEWSFDVVFDGEGRIPSSLLSDGTLRVLGLLAALHDPDHSGVLLIEEVENGLHPSRLVELLRRVGNLVTDPSDPQSLHKPLRQVILTTHSPVVVSELYGNRPESLIFLSSVSRVDPENERVSRVTVPKPVSAEGEPGTYVSPRQVRKYLSSVGDMRA